MHGQFIWYELISPDTTASKKFYPKVTGWGTQPFDKDYTMWTTGGRPHGGLYQLTEEMRAQGTPPNWLAYVEVNDVDASAELAASLGATVMHGPMDIPNVGRFALIQDPQSVVFGIYKSATGMTGWNGTPTLGRFSWHELMTPNHTKALEFYGRMFGWELLSEMDMGGDLGVYAIFGKGDAMYGGMFSMTGEFANMHPFWLYYINVKSVPAAVAAARKGGGQLHKGPMDIPGGVVAILGDPQGAAFALHHVNSEPPKAAKKSAGRKAAKKVMKKATKKPAKKAAPRKAAKKAARKSAAKKVTRKRATPKKAAKRGAPRRSLKRRSAKRR